MNENKTNINWYPGHMAKTRRLIEEKYDLIDVVYELVDARIPYSSKISDIDSIIKNKPRILILTKYDLCDVVETSKWIKYYESKGYTVVPMDLSKQNSCDNLIQVTHEVMNPLKEKNASKGRLDQEIHALVVGIPNVGKSTLINRMAGRKVAQTGNLPGVTKNLTWLHTKSDILLLDSPGILWPKFESEEVALNLASMTAIKSDVVPIDKVACHILNKLDLYYNSVLQSRYNLENTDDIMNVYETIGKKIGALLSGGEIDYQRVSLYVINDIKNELVKGITFDRYEEN